mgnify:CR=1 FL=1
MTTLLKQHNQLWDRVKKEITSKPVAYGLATTAALFSIVSNVMNIVDHIIHWL